MQTLADFGHMSQSIWPPQAFDEWREALRSACGRFNPELSDHKDVHGCVRQRDACGMELVQVVNDLDKVRRDLADIRSDFSEHLFLLVQLEGSCGVEQRGRQSTIRPGDCILVDSASPSRFYFDGNLSNHLSVHLPRQLIVADRNPRVEVSHPVMADDPMALILRALVAKLISTDARDRRAPQLRELLFSTTRHAFAADPDDGIGELGDGTEGRIDLVQVLIDQHLTEECLSPQWLANRVGVSLRTLQEDFSALGTTATEMIRIRRLQLVHDQLRQMKSGPRAPTIAEVAYSAGFNDISYFNRSFRKVFSCSPKDVLHQ